MCTIFLDKGEFCEKCSDIVQSEAYVSAQSESLNRPAAEAPTSTPDLPPSEAQQRRDKDRVFIWLGIGGSAVMMFMSLLIYSFPMLFEFDTELLAAIEAEDALEDCRLVFEEIGYVLSDGGVPDASMSCAETNVPNIISRQGGTVRVSHPNPGMHGLAEMYVTNDSHTVVLVGMEGS